jgi:hypothetical protein
MRIMTLSLALLLLMAACKNNKSAADKEPDPTAGTTAVQEQKPAAQQILENLLGSFVGVFGDNKITLLITKAEGDSVAGRSVVGGNDRPFAGTIAFADGIYKIMAKEPGDNQYDGTFNFSINADNADIVSGSWKPFKAGQKEKIYTLQRQAFKYRIDAGDYPQASQRLLKAADVENMMKSDLEFMRNEIFARHGYCFKKKHLRQQFETSDWYVPHTTDIKDALTEVEKKNIAIIKKYEKYAADYGDDYGR